MNATNTDPQETDHNPSWRMTLTVMAIAQFLSGVGFSFVLPFFQFYFQKLGVVDDADALIWYGWASFVFGVTMAVTAPIWGIVADRYGRKLMVLRSMFAGAVILGSMGLATQPWHLVMLRFFQGMTTGTVSASVTLVSSITPSASLGFSLGIMQTAVLIGSSAGPLIGGFLADHFGYRVPCGLAMVILFFGAILVLFGASERFVPPEKNKPNGLAVMLGIARTSGFPAILVIYFLIYILSTVVYAILPFFIKNLLAIPDLAATYTGLFLFSYGLLAGVSAAILGRIGDRYGHMKILVISLLLTGLISIPQALASNIWVLFFERCATGLAIGGVIPSVNALVSTIVPRDKIGSAYGMTTSVTTLGIGFGPMFGGIMVSYMGLRWPFVIMGVFAIIVAVAAKKMLSHPVHGLPSSQNSN